MLLHETRTSEMQESDAAHARVTPEELAQAAAALEIRQLAEQQQRAQTISLGEATKELGLASTPEELLAEVESERARLRDVQREQSQARSKRRLLAGTGTVASLAVISVLGLSVLHLRQQLRDALRPLPSLPIQTLASVPDNVLVHCDLATLDKLATGTAASDVFVDARPETSETSRNGAFNHEWALIKAKGKVSIQAWATAEDALNVANQQTASIFSNRPTWLPTSNMVSVRLPVDRFDKARIPDYTPHGQTVTDGSTGTVYGADVPGVEKIMQDCVEEALLGATTGIDPKTEHRMNEVAAKLENGTIHLTGYVSSIARKKKAEQLVQAAIQNHDLSLRLVDDIAIEGSKDFNN